ncbi:MAG: amidohydrolase [Chloroflexota bacterium]|nr:amidohydrolase [Chloroflexota bacterium]
MRRLPPYPDLILHNARIYTVEPDLPWASAVALRRGVIVAVGDSAGVLSLAGPQTETLDLQGRLALPGLCDAHIHFLNWSRNLSQVDLATTRSKAEMLERIAVHAQRLPAGAWIVGQGWNESWWGDTDFPTAADLRTVTGPQQPAIFWRSDMHGAVVNDRALELAGITAGTPNPPGGVIDKDAEGRPTGVLRELAIRLVSGLIPSPTPDEIASALQFGVSRLHTLGITAIHDQRMKSDDDGPEALAAYQRLNRVGALKLRVNCNVAARQLPHLAALGLSYGFGDNHLRLGHVKVFADGSLGSRTAWLLAPFEKESAQESDNLGVCLTPPDEMAQAFRQAVELGFPISVHAIGDRANRECLDIFEELAASALQPPVSHRIEHVQIISPQDLPRLAQLNITASVQPIHATDDLDVSDRLLGARGAHMYNFRSLLESGALLAFGSDAPVADPNPFLGFHAGLYRQRPERMARGPWYPDECISLEQTIRAYTLGAAQAVGWQDVIGSIAPGKRGDLIVLDRDVFELARSQTPGLELAETQVDLTLFDGEVVYRREQNTHAENA